MGQKQIFYALKNEFGGTSRARPVIEKLQASDPYLGYRMAFHFFKKLKENKYVRYNAKDRTYTVIEKDYP